MTAHAVAAATEIPPGSRRLVSIDGRSIAVINAGGTFYAIRNVCPHQGGSIGEGPLTSTIVATPEGSWEPRLAFHGRILRCPWHGLEVDLASGIAVGNPRWRCRVYETRVNDQGVVEVLV